MRLRGVVVGKPRPDELASLIEIDEQALVEKLASITSVAFSFRATCIARLSRVNSSMMHNIRNAFPS